MSENSEPINEVNMLGGIEAMSYNESPLVYYSNSAGNPGIYVEWERYTTSGVVSYNILRSTHIDGPYTLVDNVIWPANEFVDTEGAPNSYYKIQEVGSGNSIITTSQPIAGDELLLKSSLRYELLDLLNVPVYDEEVIFNGDRTRANVAFPYWNYNPRPQIRISGFSNDGDQESMIFLSEYDAINKTISGSSDNYPDGLKIKMDYMGTIYFYNLADEPQPVHSYDTVMASYNVRLFTGAQMNEALHMALQMVNAQPGSDKFPSVASAPFYYDPAMIYGATYFLIRSLLVGLNQRQKRLILQDPDSGAYDVIGNLRDTAKMYKEDFDALLKSLPQAQYPRMRTITTPEFNMPGGRSRFFRYIWKGGGG
jgi:hypothetical protein